MDLSDLSSGIYIVSVKSNFKIEKQKLIIQR
ncbi:MAG: T9SS type A sorting domain-containing protein [Bacteroidetes bacterium]|nr:T9SS type A sorting domain-containing protein [Bacteroidota bacterium]